jgi:DNA-binding transcriptional ArsR family regulator
MFNHVVDLFSAVAYVLFNRSVDYESGGRMAADALSRAFAALADPTRRDLVVRLSAGDATLTQLAAGHDVTLQAVAKHLRVLEDAGLVTRSREAQRRPAHLEAEVLDLMTGWIERYRRRAEQRFARLDDVLAVLPDDIDPLPAHHQEENP